MDEFGVLVESIGFKAHGKSAPMAPKPKSNFAPRTTTTVNASAFHDSYSLPVDELDGIFRSNVGISKTRQSQNAFAVDDDIFGGGFPSTAGQYGGVDLDSVFSTSSNRNSSGSGGYGDFFGGFGVNSSGNQERKEPILDDLLSGLGGASQSKNRVHSEAKSNDPFSVFEQSVSQPDASWPFASPPDQNTGKGHVKSSSNGFGDFSISGPPRSGSKVGVRTTINKPISRGSSNGFENADYLDAIFGGSNAGQHKNNEARPISTVQNSIFDGFFHEEKRDHVKQTTSHTAFSTNKVSSATSINKVSSATSIGNDFTSLFGDVTTSSGEFHEVKGEPAERRTARLKRHMKTNERMAEALAVKNQRDFEIQREQEEKRKLAETLDSDIKKWAAGKEGNLRALLCSLHQVLGPESGWRPVPLTDVITSVSVKTIYKKATLFVHPDKVQQRGASLHQKYVAEKVFDILKEASNKFSAEELR